MRAKWIGLIGTLGFFAAAFLNLAAHQRQALHQALQSQAQHEIAATVFNAGQCVRLHWPLSPWTDTCQSLGIQAAAQDPSPANSLQSYIEAGKPAPAVHTAPLVTHFGFILFMSLIVYRLYGPAPTEPNRRRDQLWLVASSTAFLLWLVAGALV